MTLDLRHADPVRLLEDATAADLLEVAEAVEAWDESLADVLDYVYRNRAARLLRADPRSRDMKEFVEHVRLVTAGRRGQVLNGFAQRYADRWLAYARVVDARIEARESRDSAAVRRQAHVNEILALVGARPGLAQTEIAAALHLSPQNLTRILAMLEANDLVIRRASGRKKQVWLGTQAGGAMVRSRPGLKRLLCGSRP